MSFKRFGNLKLVALISFLTVCAPLKQTLLGSECMSCKGIGQ
jgi:hypothetical protein